MEELYGIANELFVTVVGLLLVYVTALARSYVNAKVAAMDSVMDDEAKKRLLAAFESAIALAEKKGSEVNLRQVIDYVKKYNPGDLARFGLEGEKLVERAAAAVASSEKKAVHEAGAEALIVDTTPRE